MPDDAFKPYEYRSYFTGVDEIEDYSYPFDSNDDYCSSGYGVAYSDCAEHELERNNLRFEGHQFFECDLSGVNFHDSHFKNTLFTGSDVRGCQVNLDNMDACSRLSFEKAEQESHLAQGLPELRPTDKMVLDAMERGVYTPSREDYGTFFAVRSAPADEGSVNAQAQTPRPGIA